MGGWKERERREEGMSPRRKRLSVIVGIEVDWEGDKVPGKVFHKQNGEGGKGGDDLPSVRSTGPTLG